MKLAGLLTHAFFADLPKVMDELISGHFLTKNVVAFTAAGTVQVLHLIPFLGDFQLFESGLPPKSAQM